MLTQSSIFWNVYIALVYGVMYLCFVSYPIVFSELRGWTSGMTGLAYVGIGIGGMITICSEPLIRRMINAHKPDPATGKPPPESMISIVCIAAVAAPIGELIFAWTCTPEVHWIAPIISGIPFGAGNCKCRYLRLNGFFLANLSSRCHIYICFKLSRPLLWYLRSFCTSG